MKLKTEHRAAAALALTALIAGCGQNRFEKEVETEVSAVTLAREAQRGGYSLITTPELKELLDRKTDLVLVDTMPLDAYEKEHLPGAKHFLLPIPEMTEWDAEKTAGKTKEQLLALLGPDKQRLIIFYCGFVQCTRSHNGAMLAVREGYTSVKRHPGGIYAWKGADYPTEGVK